MIAALPSAGGCALSPHRKVDLMIGRRSFAMSGGLAAIGALTGAKRSAPANPLANPQAGDVIFYTTGPGPSVGIVGVLRALTEAESGALTGGAAAVWASSVGSMDVQRVLISDVLSIVPFQWRKSSDLGAAVGLPNPAIASQ